MTYNLSEIQDLVQNCLDIFMKKDIFLLEIDAGERTISHRLGCYLQTKIPELHVDCEYNKKASKMKEISSPKWVRGIQPDIVVHKRGNDSNNMLAVEVKKQGNPEIENDEIKLKELTSKLYDYKFGLLIIFNTKENSKNKPISRWFSNGEEITGS